MQRASNPSRRHIIPTVLFGFLIGIFAPLANAEVHFVKMLKYKFVPEEITINVGDTVRWENVERRAYHTIWFKEAGDKETAELFPKEFFEKTFDTPGDYPYLCGPHWEQRDMKGVVHVLP